MQQSEKSKQFYRCEPLSTNKCRPCKPRSFLTRPDPFCAYSNESSCMKGCKSVPTVHLQESVSFLPSEDVRFAGRVNRKWQRTLENEVKKARCGPRMCLRPDAFPRCWDECLSHCQSWVRHCISGVWTTPRGDDLEATLTDVEIDYAEPGENEKILRIRLHSPESQPQLYIAWIPFELTMNAEEMEEKGYNEGAIGFSVKPFYQPDSNQDMIHLICQVLQEYPFSRVALEYQIEKYKDDEQQQYVAKLRDYHSEINRTLGDFRIRGIRTPQNVSFSIASNDDREDPTTIVDVFLSRAKKIQRGTGETSEEGSS